MCYARKGLVLGIFVLALCGLSLGQSLGDVAREHRQKQQSSANQAAPKVITNEDLPKNGGLSEATVKRDDSSSRPSYGGSSTSGYKKPAEQWKSEIQAQKSAIASMQRQIDDLNASVHYVEANRYWNGAQYNERQMRKQEEVQRMQQQLDQQRRQLEDMQDGARRDGYGNSVYDP